MIYLEPGDYVLFQCVNKPIYSDENTHEHDRVAKVIDAGQFYPEFDCLHESCKQTSKAIKLQAAELTETPEHQFELKLMTRADIMHSASKGQDLKVLNNLRANKVLQLYKTDKNDQPTV